MRFFVLVLFLLSYCCILPAQQSNKVKELEAKRKKTLSEIEATSKMLQQTKQSQTSVLTKLNLLIGQINARKEVISLLNQEMNALEKEMNITILNIKSLEHELEKKKENYGESLRKMQTRRSAQDKLLFIFSADNFAQSFRRIRYLKEYSAWQKIQAKDIISKQETLKERKLELEKNRKDKLALLQEREKETYALKKEEDSQKDEIHDLKKKEKTLNAELDKKKKQAQALNRQIENAIQEEIERSEREAKLAEEAGKKDTGKKVEKETRVAEVKGGYAMTKEERTLSASFAGNKGSLPFPLKGNYKIIGHFGQHQHPNLKYVTTFNNGIDIQTSANNDACAVFNGEVTKIFTVSGSNNVIIIRHGNYLTVYSNIAEVYVKAGDKVKTRQAIGKIFTDTDAGNVAVLYFEIRKEKEKLNPEDWLN